ncbi:hypothetical protein F5883DRAFT_234514 [Diaporthe sp. PMI_573]|nr:hypothetical protein F5883DRAFT_234514 [Diaporthaceae sp. PMI_573]
MSWYVLQSFPGIRRYPALKHFVIKTETICQQGLSTFDIASGIPAMGAILSPWKRPSKGLSHHHDSQVYLLLHFISRTARTLARRIEQGLPVNEESSNCSMEISLLYFYALVSAILILIRAHETDNDAVPELVRIRALMGSCPHARPGSNYTALPIKRAEMIKEYWSLFSSFDDDPSCCFCSSDLNQDCYVCCICAQYFCAACQHAVSVLSLRERFEDFRRLNRLEKEVAAVLQAIRPIKHQDPRVMSRVLSQGPCLQHWAFHKNESFRSWRSSRTVFSHFRHTNLIQWKAVHAMNSIISLSAGPIQNVSDTDDAEVESNEDVKSDWDQVNREWRDVFYFNSLKEDFREICVHHCRMYMKKPRLDVDATLDSSGKLSAGFFDFLAEKYEAAMSVGTGIMSFLESTGFAGEGIENLAVQEQPLARNTPIPEDWARPEEEEEGIGNSHNVNSGKVKRYMRDNSDNSSSDEASEDDCSSESSEFSFPGRMEDEDGVEIDLEDFLESLLAKRKSLVNDGRLTKEEDLILNTAWNMAQAIVYQGTPRPSLKEISDKGEGYCTAPTTPVPSDSGGHGGNTPSSYGTPRSMSPVSWVLDLDE